ncbi:FecR domain-containing protein [Porticoccaceae bacterium LTM1]|nr:FecR domain-containing protein [Porticoccaceae bacterium LTM1]
MSERHEKNSHRQEAVNQVSHMVLGDGGETFGKRIAMRKCVDDNFASEVDSAFDLLAQMEDLKESSLVQSTIKGSVRRKMGRYYAIAASLALFVLAGLVLTNHPPEVEKFDRYLTRVGEQREITLPDGSLVYMNTGSELLVMESDAGRELVLRRGEAYFDVVKDAEKPFVVDAGGRKITVLGTEFNVYKEADQLTVSVTEGEVAVHKSGESMLHELQPEQLEGGVVESAGYRQWRVVSGQALNLDLAGGREQLQLSDATHSWRSGQLSFHKTPLYLIVKELNRYSGRKILIEDDGIVGLEVTATVQVDDLGVFLSGLQYSQGIQVKNLPDRIVLVSK